MKDGSSGGTAAGPGPDQPSAVVTQAPLEGNPWGVASFVLGLVGSLLALLIITFPLAFILGVLALVFGLVGLRASGRRRMTVAGTTLGAASIAFSVIGAVVTLSIVNAVSDRIDRFDEDMEELLDDAIEQLGRELDSVVDDTSDKIVEEIDDIDDKIGEQILDEIVEQSDQIEGLITRGGN